jgi:hypothetical protein
MVVKGHGYVFIKVDEGEYQSFAYVYQVANP